jgi:hypothetical protein
MTLRAVARLVINPRVEKQQGITCLLLGVRRVASMTIMSNFERQVCLFHFKAFVEKLDVTDDFRVGYFGSKSEPDPEIEIVKSRLKNSKIFSIGIGSDVDIKLDLDLDVWSNDGFFDLLIVSNVLEHIWNLENAFNNFTNMLKLNSFLYVIGPTSNFYHLSPNFYSSGYTSEFVENNMANRQFKTIVSGGVGSQRLSFMQHALRSWPSSKAHSFPLLFAYDEVKFPLRLYLYLKNFVCVVISQFMSSRQDNNPEYFTGAYCIMKK